MYLDPKFRKVLTFCATCSIINLQPGLVVSASLLGIPLPIERARLISMKYIFKISCFYSSHFFRIKLII